MKRVGITGQNGFIGQHLYRVLGLYPQEFERIDFDREFFNDESTLNAFVSKCDVIIHLAAINRHNDINTLYSTNIELTKKLIKALVATDSEAHVLFSSSSQEEQDNLYGQSKKESRELLCAWAQDSKGAFTGIIIPNVFGPFGVPFYNSFIATFCHQLTHGETPIIVKDSKVGLIHVGSLTNIFVELLNNKESQHYYVVEPTDEMKVTEVLSNLTEYRELYLKQGIIPKLETSFDVNLFNTYRSYINLETHFPAKYTQHTDARGAFVEIIRLSVGGQVSFSTTVPGVTRGNHFHTRKIERFAVIKGNAQIQLRKIGSEKTLTYKLSGEDPAYVDMPVWFTHNITNIGDDELFTIFWINEFFDPNDPDTYFENV